MHIQLFPNKIILPALFLLTGLQFAAAELTLRVSSGTSGSIFSSGFSGQGDPVEISPTQVDTWRGQTFTAKVPNDEVAAGWYLSMISLYFDPSDGDRVLGPDDIWTVRIVEWDPVWDSEDMTAWLAGSSSEPFAGFENAEPIFEDTGALASETTINRSRWLRFELDEPDTYFFEGGKAYVVLFKLESPDGASFPAQSTADLSLYNGSQVFQAAGAVPNTSSLGDIKIWIHGEAGTPDDGRDLAPQFTLSEDIELPKNWTDYESVHAMNFEPFSEAETIVSYSVTTDNEALFESVPTIDNEGVLRFKAATDASGSATVSVYVTDSGTSNNRSGVQTFTITIRDREAVILHVDTDSPAAFESQDGLSWNTAYADLQDALADAFEYDQIWVAEGIYYPDQSRAGKGAVVEDDTDSSFQLIDRVNLYGGFTGNEQSLSERIPSANPTILSGDIDHETNPDLTENGIVIRDPENHILGNNADCVVTGTETGEVMVDGFVITAGYSNNFSLAGGFSKAGSLRNCVIQGNWGRSTGGIQSFGPKLSLIFCKVYGNHGNNTGGIDIYGAELFIYSTRIQGNTGTIGSFYQSVGGLKVMGCMAQIANCLIAGNQGKWIGGITTQGGQVPGEFVEMDNCTITGNIALDPDDEIQDETGGLHSAWFDVLQIRNSVIWGNSPLGDAATLGINANNTFASYVQGADLGSENLNGVTDTGDTFFVRPIGTDRAPTISGIYSLADDSPLIGAGNGSILSPDYIDLDSDADFAEALPLDLAGNPRESGDLDVGALERNFDAEPSDSIETFRAAFGMSLDGSNDNEDWSGNGIENALYYAFGVPELFGESPTLSDEESGTMGLPVLSRGDAPGQIKLVYSTSEDAPYRVISQRADASWNWVDVGNDGIVRRTVETENGQLIVEEFEPPEDGGFYRVKVVNLDE